MCCLPPTEVARKEVVVTLDFTRRLTLDFTGAMRELETRGYGKVPMSHFIVKADGMNLWEVSQGKMDCPLSIIEASKLQTVEVRR